MELKQKKKTWLSLGVIGSFLLGKLKLLLVILKIAKVGSLVSIFISIGAYALVYGWKFAVALVYLIYIHETGHLLAARKKGIKTSSAIFIPFVGAFISIKKEPKNANEEAFLAYGGPLLGTLGFLPAIPLFFLTKSPFWLLVVSLGAMINLFNLIPLHPMDGGRIVGVISTKFWLLGIAGMAIYLWFNPNPILFLFLIFGILKGWGEFRNELPRKKRNKVIEVYQEGSAKLEQYIASVEDRIILSNRWKWELEEIKTDLKGCKKWYLPFKEDDKWLHKQELLLKEKIMQELLSKIELDEENDYLQTLNSFQKEIQDHEDKQRFEENYYVSSSRDKAVWFCLYVGLAVFLMFTTFYTGSLLHLSL